MVHWSGLIPAPSTLHRLDTILGSSTVPWQYRFDMANSFTLRGKSLFHLGYLDLDGMRGSTEKACPWCDRFTACASEGQRFDLQEEIVRKIGGLGMTLMLASVTGYIPML
ncbi:hypothetical protein N7523_008321 [Penicillium sp. IBT 18751x]|nr:hypothetical protein N7523_008321 [Penicillium sp. IBT 18751x]